jgi:hypothetical protein
MTTTKSTGTTGGSHLPASSDETKPAEPVDPNASKYDKPPVEERVPDENNGPQITETPEEYEKRKGKE